MGYQVPARDRSVPPLKTTTTAATPSLAAPNAVDRAAILAALKAAAGGTPVVKSRFQFSKTDPAWAVVGIFYKGDPQGGAALVHKTAAGWKVVQTGSQLEDCWQLAASTWAPQRRGSKSS